MKREIKIFKSFAEEEESKIQEMAGRSIDERMRILYELQRISFPETFDQITGKRLPLERKIRIIKRSS
ncbi:MAG: hypothetical protein H7329_15610 [Opitutaceae bacterium]|nr:hypothetical protein [Cytophagales bacterium]